MVGAGRVPPFQLTALCFAVGGVIGFLDLARRGLSPAVVLAQPARVWALGLTRLFGYHSFYFTALQNARPAEAGLMAYLWPLLIVLFSGLLPVERLGLLHVLGGLAGAALLIAARFEGVGLVAAPGPVMPRPSFAR